MMEEDMEDDMDENMEEDMEEDSKKADKLYAKNKILKREFDHILSFRPS